MVYTYSITLPKEQEPKTIRQLLEEEWLVPRKVRHFLRTRKNVRLNGNPAMFHELVTAGDCLTLQLEESDYQYQAVAKGTGTVDVIFEDEHLIVVNKPVGIKTHPNQPDETGTLLNDLTTYLDKKQQRPFVVHRLDKETSGLILFAKNPLVLPILGRLLEQKKIYRRYQATVLGTLKHNQTITKKIGRHRHDRRKRVIDEKNGQTAITHVEIAKIETNTTNVYCVLETGRTHQIRVHLASLGHPIVGDPLYQNQKASRLFLHAYEMYLIHPFTKEKLQLQGLPGLW